MEYLLVPLWFLAFGSILDFIFGCITLLVSGYAFKVYSLTGQRKSKLFGIGFLLLSASYFLLATTGYLQLQRIQELVPIIHVSPTGLLEIGGVYAYMLLSVLGTMVLAYMTLKEKDKTTLSLLAILVALLMGTSYNTTYVYHMLSCIFLLYTTIYFFEIARKRKRSMIVFTAFAMILFGHAILVFSGFSYYFYPISHLFMLIGYLLILYNFMVVLRGKKK